MKSTKTLNDCERYRSRYHNCQLIGSRLILQHPCRVVPLLFLSEPTTIATRRGFSFEDIEVGQATMKPTPTEYMGVRFRSKSEAMFAFHLNKANFLYEYENGKAGEIHDWDFYVFWCDDEDRRNFGGCDFPVFVEYKPSKPTDTYIQNLKAKIETYFEFRISSFADEARSARGSESIKHFRENSLHHHFRSQFWIVFGSPFSPAQKTEDQVCKEIGTT